MIYILEVLKRRKVNTCRDSLSTILGTLALQSIVKIDPSLTVNGLISNGILIEGGI